MMKTLLITLVTATLTTISFSVQAQEDFFWKLQQYEKSQAEINLESNSVEFLAQVSQKDPIENQQKDPESQPEPITDGENSPVKEEKIAPENTFLQLQQISPDNESGLPMPQINQSLPSKEQKNEEAKKEDDSVLEFNFLYFIIHKFKLSDILE